MPKSTPPLITVTVSAMGDQSCKDEKPFHKIPCHAVQIMGAKLPLPRILMTPNRQLASSNEIVLAKSGDDALLSALPPTGLGSTGHCPTMRGGDRLWDAMRESNSII
jgi:hypothetical protein